MGTQEQLREPAPAPAQYRARWGRGHSIKNPQQHLAHIKPVVTKNVPATVPSARRGQTAASRCTGARIHSENSSQQRPRRGIKRCCDAGAGVITDFHTTTRQLELAPTSHVGKLKHIHQCRRYTGGYKRNSWQSQPTATGSGDGVPRPTKPAAKEQRHAGTRNYAQQHTCTRTCNSASDPALHPVGIRRLAPQTRGHK